VVDVNVADARLGLVVIGGGPGARGGGAGGVAAAGRTGNLLFVAPALADKVRCIKQLQRPFTLPERVLLALGMAPTGTVVLAIRSIGQGGCGNLDSSGCGMAMEQSRELREQ